MYPFDQNNQQAYQQYAQASDSGDYSQVGCGSGGQPCAAVRAERAA